MLSLANYIMQNRRNAILLALLFAIIPLMGWVADIIMVLVTLRKGAKEGGVVLIWIMLPSLLLALKGYPQFLLYNALAGSVLTYCFALLLRQTTAWPVVLQAAAVIGVIEIVAIHLVVPGLGMGWSNDLMGYFETLRHQVLEQTANNSEMQFWAGLLSKVIIGFQITFLFVYNLIIVLLARFVQAKLYHPAGLRPELYNIRVGIVAILLFFLVVVACLAGNDIAMDCLLMTIMPLIVAGISLVHYLAAAANLSIVWFIGFYGLLILFFPYCAVVLSALALADSWFNFRQRFKLKNQ